MLTKNEIIKILMIQVENRTHFFKLKYLKSLNNMKYDELVSHYNKYNKGAD